MQYAQPPQGYPPPQKTSGSTILVIVVVVVLGVVFFIGIMAVLAISGVRKYLQNAKMVEATNSVAMIGRSAASAYDPSDPSTASLCASATEPIPSSLTFVSGKKYMSSPTDWARDLPSNAGFACLKFDMSYPQYYQYDYKRIGSGAAPGDQFHAIAHGDLDGDGVASTFDLTGQITKGGAVAINPTIAETNPTE